MNELKVGLKVRNFWHNDNDCWSVLIEHRGFEGGRHRFIAEVSTEEDARLMANCMGVWDDVYMDRD